MMDNLAVLSSAFVKAKQNFFLRTLIYVFLVNFSFYS